jgi:hypothetical protein
MKTLFKKLLIACVALGCASQVQAQKAGVKNADYVITIKGDTVAARLNFPVFGKNTYAIDLNGNQDLTPKVVKEYYIVDKNERYRSVLRPGESKPVFLKVLEAGKINLYEDLLQNSVTNAYSAVWYITKDSDKLTELKITKLSPAKPGKKKNEFEESISDNKNVYDTYIQEKKYTFNQVRGLIHLYNTGEWTQGWPNSLPH